MKAISLWQPWASAIALGSKQIETRHWSTNYRGVIAIHAAKRLVRSEFDDFNSSYTWLAALHALGKTMGDGKRLENLMPFGAIVAVARLVTVRPTESFTIYEVEVVNRAHPGYQWRERDMGDFYPGRFGWVLQDVHMLPNPVPCVGRQALFDLPLDVVRRVCHELQHVHDEQIAKLRKWAGQCDQVPQVPK